MLTHGVRVATLPEHYALYGSTKRPKELFGKDLPYRKENKMVNDPILIKELIEKLDTIPEDIIKKSIIETLKEDENIKIKLRNNIPHRDILYGVYCHRRISDIYKSI